jgi:type IV secretion system protein VirD4
MRSIYSLIRLTLLAAFGLFGYIVAALALIAPVLAILIGFCILIVANKRRLQSFTAFGSARWGEEQDLRRAGMIGGKGLCVGYFAGSHRRKEGFKALFDLNLSSDIACRKFFGALRNDPSLYPVGLANAIHTVVIAPVGVGKSSALAVPFLLTCEDSCVVLDLKGELASLTAQHRREKMGHRVVLLDPFRMVTDNPDTYNPIASIGPDSPHVIEDSRDIAKALVVRTGQEVEPFWNNGSELWISAMTAAVIMFVDGEKKSLQSVRETLCNPTTMAHAIDTMRGEGGMILARMGHQLTQYTDKTLDSVLATSNTHMQFLDTPAVYDSTIASSFDPSELVNGKCTVYMIMPPDRMRSNAGLLRLWISSLLRISVRAGIHQKRPVYYVLDEAASLGHLEVLDDCIDKYRSYMVRTILFYQSMGQLKKCWPNDGDVTLLSNTSQVFFGVNDKRTAEYVSAMLGKETILVESGGETTGTSGQSGQNGQGSTSRSSSRNSGWAMQGRELLRPEEVVALDSRMAIVFTPGVPPFWTCLVKWFENMPNLRSSPAKDLMRSLILLSFAGILALGITVLVQRKNRQPVFPVSNSMYPQSRPFQKEVFRVEERATKRDPRRGPGDRRRGADGRTRPVTDQDGPGDQGRSEPNGGTRQGRTGPGPVQPK